MRTTERPAVPELDRIAALEPAAALAALEAAREGLSSREAAARLGREGRNELGRSGRTLGSLLLAQVRSPLLGLLFAAAVVSIGVGERTDGGIILGIMGLSVGLGFFNEYRSEQTLASLRERTGRRATVLRDGSPLELPAAELVRGDVCVLRMGDVVPADLRLLEASELTIDEATLSGEPYPVEKQTGPVEEPPGDVHPNCAYMGTVVRGGSGLAVVAATGMRTRLGAVAGGVQEHQPPTAFQRGLSSFAVLLARVTAVLTVSIFVLNAVLGRPVLDSLLFSLAIAVGLTPQLLPAIVTVSLSTGARRMARRAVLVKRLVAIEDLGDADVLFTDKTGTLTEGEIRYREAVDPAGAPSPDLTLSGLLASDLDFEHGDTPLGNTLDLAIWRSLDPEAAAAALRGAGRVATLPFTFDRRRTSVVLERDGRRRLVCKGAAEEVLGRCASVRLPGGARPLAATRAQVEQTLVGLLEQGHRLLALAERPIETKPSYGDADEQGLELDGFLVFADPPKADAAESVARLQRLGIELKVLTGDHERTAAHVCAELGLPVKGVVRGGDLAGKSEEELASLVASTTVFARVGPEQKAALIAAAQRNGDDVAYLGDGVNDAVALHKADVGISVDTAVDVAKEAADVLLLEKSLRAIADGVVEGRRIFANTTKYVLMGTSSNFGNMFSAAGASLFLSFLPMLPSQILLNNMLYDISELTIPTDVVDEELLARPEHWDVGFIRRFMTFFGPISSIYDFLTFAVMLWVFDAHAPLFRSGWFVESLATQSLVVFVIRTRRIPFFSSRPSRPLLATTIAVVLVGLALPYTPLAHALGFRSLPWLFLVILAAMAVTYLSLAELGKSYFYRHPGGPGPGAGPAAERSRWPRARLPKFLRSRARPPGALAGGRRRHREIRAGSDPQAGESPPSTSACALRACHSASAASRVADSVRASSTPAAASA
jgi:Mg2+-importing ATPase